MPEGGRVLVTGGAGFIGSHIVERLLPTNQVTVFDSFRRDSLSSTPWADSPRLRKVVGDVLDRGSLQCAMQGHDFVVHCAAVAGVDTVTKLPVDTLRVNILGSFNVLEAVSQVSGCNRVVCFSTSEVFGPQASRVGESSPAVIGTPGEPRWTYAVGKLAEEHAALAYHRQFGLPAVILRPFNVYGPRQTGEGAINNFTRRALRGEPLIIRGSGRQTRSWTFVSDMVDGVILALDKEAAVGQAYNIGNPQPVVSTVELADMVCRLTGSTVGTEFTQGPTAEIENRSPDISKAQRELEYSPRVDLEQGLIETIRFLRGEVA